MIEFKPGVKIFGVRPEIQAAWQVAEGVYAAHGHPVVTITSVVDGKHGKGSLHPNGLATDLRTVVLDPGYGWGAVVIDLHFSLTDEFDVVLEKDHIHIEFQPK